MHMNIFVVYALNIHNGIPPAILPNIFPAPNAIAIVENANVRFDSTVVSVKYDCITPKLPLKNPPIIREDIATP